MSSWGTQSQVTWTSFLRQPKSVIKQGNDPGFYLAYIWKIWNWLLLVWVLTLSFTKIVFPSYSVYDKLLVLNVVDTVLSIRVSRSTTRNVTICDRTPHHNFCLWWTFVCPFYGNKQTHNFQFLWVHGKVRRGPCDWKRLSLIIR